MPCSAPAAGENIKGLPAQTSGEWCLLNANLSAVKIRSRCIGPQIAAKKNNDGSIIIAENVDGRTFQTFYEVVKSGDVPRYLPKVYEFIQKCSQHQDCRSEESFKILENGFNGHEHHLELHDVSWPGLDEKGLFKIDIFVSDQSTLLVRRSLNAEETFIAFSYAELR